MYKRLRIIFPSIQLVLFTGVFVLKFAVERWGLRLEYGPLQHFIWAVNYPIWLVAATLAFPASWVPDAFGWLLIGIAFVSVFLLVPGLLILWYFVISEFQERVGGRSLIRFSNPLKEILTVGVLMLFGGRALYDAYSFKYIWQTTALSRTCESASRVILVLWGVILVGTAVYDLTVFFKARAHIASNPRK